MEDFARLREAMQTRYGASEGLRVFQTVVPGILSDFMKMMAKAPAGVSVQEEYILEDHKGRIVLRAESRTGKPVIRAEFIPY